MTTTPLAPATAVAAAPPRRRRRSRAGLATPVPLQATTYILLTGGVILFLMPFVIMVIN